MRAVGLAMAALSAVAAPARADPPTRSPSISRSVPVTEFDAVEVSAPVTVRLVVADRGAARVRGRVSGTADALAAVSILVRNRTLMIQPRGPVMRSAPDSWRGPLPPPAEVVIEAAAINRLSVSGSADVEVAMMGGEDVAVRLGGSGRIAVDQVDAGRMTIAHEGSGPLVLRGRAGDLTAALAGSGPTDAAMLDVGRIVLAVTGSGAAQMRASDTADVVTAGSGAISIAGRATCQVRASGTGRVTCGRVDRR